jgi:hypothetical protein
LANTGAGSSVQAEFPLLLAAAESLYAVAMQMLSTAVPTVVPPIALDGTSLQAHGRLHAQAFNLVQKIDSGAWVLAGAAAELLNSALAFIAQEADNAGLFNGHSPGGIGAPQLPAFPPPPGIPDLPVPDVPAPPGAIDAEYTSQLVNGGVGDGPHLAAADFWTNTGQTLTQAAEVIEVLCGSLRNGWSSPDAENVHAALRDFLSWAREMGPAATDLGRHWNTHAADWRRTRDNIPTPEEARGVKVRLLDAIQRNMSDGGLSTPEVVEYTNQYGQQNLTTDQEMGVYGSGESGAPPFSGPGAPPEITAAGPPRVPGAARPAPGTLQDRLTDDQGIKGLNDPKQMMSTLMSAASGLGGGLGSFGGLGKGLFEPIQSIPQQIAQQVSQFGQMAGKAIDPTQAGLAGLAGHAVPNTAAKAGGAGGGGGGVKPAGLGGGARLGTPSGSGVGAAPSAPAVTGVPASATSAAAPGAGGMGMMPGAMAGAGAKGSEKRSARNKQLSPDDDSQFDSDQQYSPPVLGAPPEPSKKPSYDRKIATAPINAAPIKRDA